MNRTGKMLIFALFIFILSLFSLTTIAKSFFLITNCIGVEESKDVKKTITEIEQIFKDNTWGKQKWTDIYGVTLKMLNKSIIGNFEFIKTEDELINIIGKKYFSDHFINEMIQLNTVFSKYQSNSNLLYVQIPSRFSTQPNDLSNIYDYDNQVFDEILVNLKTQNIATIDFREEVSAMKDTYFKTDIHLTTQGEWQVLQKIVEELEQEFGLTFPNKEIVLDQNNYEIIKKQFVGNMARTVGEYFASKDIFELFYPNFDTKFTLYNGEGIAIKSGKFEDVVMNGMDKNATDKYQYWVTNYMQFTMPCYEYVNHNLPNGPEILVNMDSLGYRALSYLTLMCSKITVVDTRYGGDYHMTRKLMSNQYDAVIVLQSNNLMGTSLVVDMLNNPQAEIVLVNVPEQIVRDEEYSIEITVKNTGDESWSEMRGVRLCIFQDGGDYGYRIQIEPNKEVMPGEEYTFVLEKFVAPTADDTTLAFQMVEEGISWFGEKKDVEIFVIT